MFACRCRRWPSRVRACYNGAPFHRYRLFVVLAQTPPCPERTRSPPKRSPPSASASATTSTKFDVANVIQLDELELRELGPARRAPAHPRGVRPSTTSTTPRSPTPSTSPRRAAARSTRATARSARSSPVGGDVKKLQARRHRDHALQRRARHLRLPAAHLGLRPARVDRLVRRGGGRRRLAAHAARRSTAASTSGRSRRCRCARRPPITCGAARSASSA